MGSFYGTHAIAGGSGGGTSNYDDLTNKPLINITGSIDSPIDLSKLNLGQYSLKGSFIYLADDVEVKTFDYQNYVAVVTDSITGNKVVEFETIESEKVYINTICYDAEGLTYSYHKSPVSAEIMELTKAEYDALPDEKKFDGTAYFITDVETDAELHYECTQAEYDSLSEEEKNSGAIFFITDAESDGGVSKTYVDEHISNLQAQINALQNIINELR